MSAPVYMAVGRLCLDQCATHQELGRSARQVVARSSSHRWRAHAAPTPLRRRPRRTTGAPPCPPRRPPPNSGGPTGAVRRCRAPSSCPPARRAARWCGTTALRSTSAATCRVGRRWLAARQRGACMRCTQPSGAVCCRHPPAAVPCHGGGRGSLGGGGRPHKVPLAAMQRTSSPPPSTHTHPTTSSPRCAVFTLMAEQGVAVYAYDMHGHGRSQPSEPDMRCYVESFNHLVGATALGNRLPLDRRRACWRLGPAWRRAVRRLPAWGRRSLARPGIAPQAPPLTWVRRIAPLAPWQTPTDDTPNPPSPPLPGGRRVLLCVGDRAAARRAAGAVRDGRPEHGRPGRGACRCVRGHSGPGKGRWGQLRPAPAPPATLPSGVGGLLRQAPPPPCVAAACGVLVAPARSASSASTCAPLTPPPTWQCCATRSAGPASCSTRRRSTSCGRPSCASRP